MTITIWGTIPARLPNINEVHLGFSVDWVWYSIKWPNWFIVARKANMKMIAPRSQIPTNMLIRMIIQDELKAYS